MSSETSLADILASSTKSRKVYRVWCETEGTHVSSGAFTDAAPSTCPNDEAHTVDPSSVTAVATEAPVAVPALEALAQYFVTRPSLQNIMSMPVELSKGSSFERIASFSWPAGRPLISVMVRGASFAKRIDAAGETLELAIVNPTNNVTVGSRTITITDNAAQTLWVNTDVPGSAAGVAGEAAPGTTQPQVVHYELLVSSSEPFTIDCVAGWG